MSGGNHHIKLALIFLGTFLGLCIGGCKPAGDKFVPVGEDFFKTPAEKFTVKQLNDLRIKVETDYGSFTIAFYADRAPILVRNFIKLAQQGFYNGLRFHMVVPQYMVITGDPKGDGTGGPGYWVKPNFPTIPHERGAVGMSHPPFSSEQIGSQFYVMLTNSMRETNAYPVFGYIVSGMDVLDRIGDIPSSGPQGKPHPWAPATTVRIIKMTILQKAKP